MTYFYFLFLTIKFYFWYIFDYFFGYTMCSGSNGQHNKYGFKEC